MESWTLTNTIRVNPSYLGEEAILQLCQGSELNSQSVATLKEIARVLSLNPILRKAELLVDIRSKVLELRYKPLTLASLQREASARLIPTHSLTYQDLRILLNYEKITHAGLVYFPRNSRSTLYRILKDTEKGSWLRMMRLSQSYNDIISMWDVLPHSSEQLHHTLTYCTAVLVDDRNQHTPILYVNSKDDIGEILLTTIPDSIERNRLLYAYDPILLQEFRAKHRLSPDQDISQLIALHLPDSDYVKTYEYTHDRDPLLRALATTKANTLGRYAEVSCLGLNPYMEELCTVPQIPDQRPTFIRDHDPSDYESLSVAVLQSLVIREGLYDLGETPSDDKEDLIDELTMAYVCPCFMRTDLIENTDQTQTSLLTELSEVPKGQLYAFGMRDGTDKYVYYERDELMAKFNSEQAFIDIHTNKSFEITAIKRLYVLSFADYTQGASQFQTCLTSLLSLAGTITAQEQDLVREMRDNLEVKNALELLFEAGFYMRRWDGNKERYPVKASDTEPEAGMALEAEEERLFQRVNDSLERFRVAVEALPGEIKSKFWGLRLKNYVRSGYYSSAEDSDDGVSIRDRFELVCQGNGAEAPINSCIRLTSGWFIFTAMYYRWLIWKEVVGGVREFEIEFVS